MSSKLPWPRSWPLITVLGLFWTAALGAGFTILEREEFTPVALAAPVANFPPASTIPLAVDQPTLVLFAHPHCPCTRASLHELDGLLAEIEGKVSVVVVFTIPSGVPPRWEEGDLWNASARMPGVRVMRDPAGAEAVRFNVKGSGHALLYTPAGQLLFSGGITPSRGHEGDNAGRAAVVSFVRNGRAGVDRAPVFGCALL